ncbi:PP2C family protein-serine/threonine phosphatase [Streptomyces longispororuber]|uniref:PP2C family protein-serine/threonine phosphatase n=1 Tax=Streptomyces longispororuber TaxID=68230 RepID=UPI0036F76212
MGTLHGRGTAAVGARRGRGAAVVGARYGRAAAAVLVPVAAALLTLAAGPPFSALLALAPLPAARWLSARATAALGIAAVAVAVATGPPGSAPEVALLLSVAGVAAWAVATARTRVRDRRELTDMSRLAELLQDALARPLPEHVGHIGLAVHTRAADPRARLGGDVHDVVLTPGGPRLLLADVRGHGPAALRVAAAVLAAFRRTAAAEPDPVRLAGTLDEQLRPELGPEDFVTLLLVDFRPGEALIVNCGHPPPVRAGRRLRVLEPPEPSPPLGLHPAPRPHRVHLAPGERLLLYTDGLTEARDAGRTPFRLDTAEVHAALAAPTAYEAVHALAGLLDRHTGAAPLADDLTCVLVQPAVPAPAPAPGTGTRAEGRR